MSEQFSETFDFDEEPSIQPRRESASEARNRKEAERIKSLLTPERIADLLPTDDLRHVFQSIKADTFSLHGLASLGKKQNVLEIREKKFLNEEMMRKIPVVYVGAGVDVEYPLSLGARHVIMVDPMLKEANTVARLRQRIHNLSGGSFTETKTHFVFSFDFGNGKEEVKVEIDPRFYGEKGDASIAENDRFVPPQEISMLMAFQSGDLTKDLDTVECLKEGGYIFSNQSLDRFTSEYFKDKSAERENFLNASVEDKRKMLDIIYQAKGFVSVPLESFEDNFSETFLRKIKKD